MKDSRDGARGVREMKRPRQENEGMLTAWQFFESPRKLTNGAMEFADAILEVDRRRLEVVREYEKKGVFKYSIKAKSRFVSLCQEFHSLNNDLAKRKIILHLLGSAENKGLPVDGVIDSFVTILSGMGLSVDDDVLQRLLHLVKSYGLLSLFGESEAAALLKSMAVEEIKSFREISFSDVIPLEYKNAFYAVADELLALDPALLAEMFDPEFDPDVIGELASKGLNAKSLSAEDISSLQVYIETIAAEVDLWRERYLKLGEKLKERLAYVVQPLKAVFDNKVGVPDSFIDLLSIVFIDMVESKIFLDVEITKSGLLRYANGKEAESVRLEMISSAVYSDHFWYAVLIRAAQRFGIGGDSFGKQEAARILLESIHSPNKVMRIHCHNKAMKFRTFIAKNIAPFFVVQRADVSNAFKKVLPSNLTAENIFYLVSNLISNLFKSKEFIDKYNGNIKLNLLFIRLWIDLVGPVSDHLLMAVAESISHAQVPVFSFDDLEIKYLESLEPTSLSTPQESVLAEKLGEEVFQQDTTSFPPILVDDPAMVEELPPIEDTPRRKWVYVFDPHRPERSQEILCINGDREDSLDNFVRDHKVAVIVKTSSLTRAVEYFESAGKELWHQMSHVAIDGQRWAKLKRGKQRILARLEEESVLFHTYPRREWTRQMFDH